MQSVVEPSTFKQVWLCDDDPDDHYVFAEALTKVLPNAALSICPDGKELLSRLDLERPDILFLDINMPVINGIETLKKISQLSNLCDLPIVMYSVSDQKTDISACHQLGATLYLVKPQLFQELVAQLKAIVNLDWDDKEMIKSLRYDGEKFISMPSVV